MSLKRAPSLGGKRSIDTKIFPESAHLTIESLFPGDGQCTIDKFISVNCCTDQGSENPKQQIRFKGGVVVRSVDAGRDRAPNLPVHCSRPRFDGFRLRRPAKRDSVGALERAMQAAHGIRSKIAMIVHTLRDPGMSDLQNRGGGTIDQPASLAINSPHLRLWSEQKGICILGSRRILLNCVLLVQHTTFFSSLPLFHLRRSLERHLVQMFVKFRHQPDCGFLHRHADSWPFL